MKTLWQMTSFFALDRYQIMRLILCNSLVAVLFSVLWVWEYDWVYKYNASNLADHVDDLMPTVWMYCFYFASLAALLQSPLWRVPFIALFYAGLAWLVFHDVVLFVLSARYDPWF